jgi:hypothetical protein
MRISLIAALALVIAGCGQPERPPDSQAQPPEQAEQVQPQTPTASENEPQEEQRPYGLGAPWPEAAFDSTGSTILNEIVVEFQENVSRERQLFLVDSIAGRLRAAARVSEFAFMTRYSLRWPAELEIEQDSVIADLKRLADVYEVWLEFLVSPADETPDTVPS